MSPCTEPIHRVESNTCKVKMALSIFRTGAHICVCGSKRAIHPASVPAQMEPSLAARARACTRPGGAFCPLFCGSVNCASVLPGYPCQAPSKRLIPALVPNQTAPSSARMVKTSLESNPSSCLSVCQRGSIADWADSVCGNSWRQKRETKIATKNMKGNCTPRRVEKPWFGLATIVPYSRKLCVTPTAPADVFPLASCRPCVSHGSDLLFTRPLFG